jgi:chromosome segregation ATPase
MNKENLKKIEAALTESHGVARDLRNKFIGWKAEMDQANRRETVFSEGVQALKEELASRAPLEEDVNRLKAENANLATTNRALQEETQRFKREWQAEQVKLEAVRQELAVLKGEIEAARAYIAKGEEAHRILSSLGH